LFIIKTINFVSTRELHISTQSGHHQAYRMYQLYAVINTSVSTILLCIVSDSGMNFNTVNKIVL